jgi:hypothetical protein
MSSNESESDEAEEEEEEALEEEEPQPKRGKLNFSMPSRQEPRPRPSAVSTLSELTQDWDEEEQDVMEKESDENDFQSPVKKSRNDVSVSTPIHQLAEEDVDDNHWGKPSVGTKKPYQLDPVLGLHLEDFGAGEFF